MQAQRPLSFFVFLLFIAFPFLSAPCQDFSDGDSSPEPLFNMHWLESTWQSRAPQNAIPTFNTGENTQTIDPSDRYSVVEYVLEQCPLQPIIYPSEEYFYFKFYAGHRLISGNLRFCDAPQGRIHFGYFDEFDRGFQYTGSIETGVNGTILEKNEQVTVSFRDIHRTFQLDRSWQSTEGLQLAENEELISGILDESGYYFWLVYNEPAQRFYYVLNEQKVPEARTELASGGIHFQIGQVSRFIFFDDEPRSRKILVGVMNQHIESNNYFDGPFDQVPPDLDIKPKLERIYPYVKLRGGIDQHGNFLDLVHTRVAITPYVKYDSTTQFLNFANRSLDPTLSDQEYRFLELVYESKMDFHQRLGLPETSDSAPESSTEQPHQNGESIDALGR